MKFPLLGDIASVKVVSVDINSTAEDALAVMLKENHRNVIVLDGNNFHILTIMDVLNLKSEGLGLECKLSELHLSKVPTIAKDKNVLDTLEYLNSSAEYLCVINPDNTLYGLVTHTDISSNIDPDTLMDNYRLKDFLKLGRRMKWIDKNAITSSLLQSMTYGHFDNVVVVEDMVPIGILTTKDVMRLIKTNVDLELSVQNYMTLPVDTIGRDSSIKEALDFIKNKHYRRVIVVDEENKLSGIIAQKELISLTYSKWALLMKDYQEELTELNNMLESKYKEYESRASKDALTGLYNRHKFAELYLSSYTSMTQRNNKMSLILLDIDFFKKVNDTFGHNVGDQVLIQLSHVLLRTLRNIDIICRWGGEEFIILLPTADLKSGQALAEKLRLNVEKMDLETVGGVTSSFGLCEVREGESMEDCVSRADRALYLAKSNGRNCVKTELDL
ncbi:diguanylate cyclase [Sulfurimonas sp.]|nr:diguanylate cyclase [Sulfurimonas sp.]